jgi:hypothetical protein
MTYLRRDIRRNATRVSRHSMHYPSTTLPAGTIVLTLRGALSVEDLHRGDRVVTKAGASEVKRVHTRDPDNFTLEFDNHETVYVLGDPALPSGVPSGSVVIKPNEQ